MLTDKSMSPLQPLSGAFGEDARIFSIHRVLDHLHVAIAVLNLQGTVLFRNVLAQQLDEGSAPVHMPHGGRLRFLDTTAQSKFLTAMRRFSGRIPPRTEDGVTITAGATDARLPSLIGSLRLLPDSPPVVLATFVDNEGALCEASVNGFSRAFGLTPAEQRLAHYLATGGRLRSAAQSFGVSPHTVRNQLHSVFAKVGVQRQVDLMRLILVGCVTGLAVQVHQSADAIAACTQLTDTFL